MNKQTTFLTLLSLSSIGLLSILYVILNNIDLYSYADKVSLFTSLSIIFSFIIYSLDYSDN